ncbi:hypothetical protein TSOC_012031, partial [Tetrabaena socialis]
GRANNRLGALLEVLCREEVLVAVEGFVRHRLVREEGGGGAQALPRLLRIARQLRVALPFLYTIATVLHEWEDGQQQLRRMAELVAALEKSQLLDTICAVVLSMPPPRPPPLCSLEQLEQLTVDMAGATTCLANTLSVLTLAPGAGPSGSRRSSSAQVHGACSKQQQRQLTQLRKRLLRLLLQPSVQCLQQALLTRFCINAGVAPGCGGEALAPAAAACSVIGGNGSGGGGSGSGGSGSGGGDGCGSGSGGGGSGWALMDALRLDHRLCGHVASRTAEDMPRIQMAVHYTLALPALRTWMQVHCLWDDTNPGSAQGSPGLWAMLPAQVDEGLAHAVHAAVRLCGGQGEPGIYDARSPLTMMEVIVAFATACALARCSQRRQGKAAGNMPCSPLLLEALAWMLVAQTRLAGEVEAKTRDSQGAAAAGGSSSGASSSGTGARRVPSSAVGAAGWNAMSSAAQSNATSRLCHTGMMPALDHALRLFATYADPAVPVILYDIALACARHTASKLGAPLLRQLASLQDSGTCSAGSGSDGSVARESAVATEPDPSQAHDRSLSQQLGVYVTAAKLAGTLGVQLQESTAIASSGGFAAPSSSAASRQLYVHRLSLYDTFVILDGLSNIAGPVAVAPGMESAASRPELLGSIELEQRTRWRPAGLSMLTSRDEQVRPLAKSVQDAVKIVPGTRVAILAGGVPLAELLLLRPDELLRLSGSLLCDMLEAGPELKLDEQRRQQGMIGHVCASIGRTVGQIMAANAVYQWLFALLALAACQETAPHAPTDETVIDRCLAELVAFDQHFDQQLASASSPPASALAWLGVMRDEQMVQRTLKLLRRLNEICLAAETARPLDARIAAFVNLNRLRSCDQPTPLAQQLEAELTSPEFAAAAAVALDGVAATFRRLTAWMESGAFGDRAASILDRTLTAYGCIIGDLAQYAEFVAGALLRAEREGVRNRSGDIPAASSEESHPPLPAAVARLTGVLARSQLLPAMCRAVLLPPGGFDRGQGPALDLLQHLHSASDTACRALFTVLIAPRGLHEEVYGNGGGNSPPAGALSPGEPLLALLAHPDVHRLQRAVLGRLIAHGGGGGGAAGSASGSGDGWALALEETRRGQAVLWPGPNPHRAAESYHSTVLQASLYAWAVMLRLRGRVTGGTPPQREAAALAAAATRAVCHMQRGQGMGGLYDNPAWTLPGSELVAEGFNCTQQLLLLPAGEARAVAPDWLEAAAWAAAATVDAMSAGGSGRGSELRRLLNDHLGNLARLARSMETGLASVSPAAQLDGRARLAAAGTLRTLDAALRRTAADATHAAPAADAGADCHDLHVTTVHFVSTLLRHSEALPILPAPATSGSRQQQGQQGRGHEGDQLGVLVTAGKWARLLAVGWEAPPEGPTRPAAALKTSAVVMVALGGIMKNAAVGLRPRLAEAALASGAAAQGSKRFGSADRCVSVEHEAFALAARSLCLLAAPLALCAARGGASVGLNPEQLDLLITGAPGAVWALAAWAGPGAELLLPAGQVLAAQPHRLLAAAAQLLRRTPQPLPSLAGLASVSPAAQLDGRARLAAAGTLRTLDAALRRTAADATHAAPAADAGADCHDLHVTTVHFVSTLLRHSEALPILPAPATSGSRQQQGQQGRGHEGDQLGVLVTAGKWARLLAVGWEAPPEGPTRPAAALKTSAVVMVALGGIMKNAAVGLRPRLAEAALASGAAAQGSKRFGSADRCVSVEHEAFALAARSLCLLAAPLALCAARGGASVGLNPEQLDLLITGAPGAVWALAAWAGPGAELLLPAGQVLAAQPHRLLAAAAQLLRRTPQPLPSLAGGLVPALVSLAAHEQLSSRLRGWLAPPPPQAGGRDRGGGELGCLREAVQGAVPRLLQIDRHWCGMVLALLKLAAGDGGGASGGGGDGGGGSGGDDFRNVGLAMADQLSGIARPTEWMTLPTGSSTADLVRELVALGAGAGPGAAVEVAALPAALKHLGPSAQLLRLRVCGNPRCDNFGAASEGELLLKKCSGCKAGQQQQVGRVERVELKPPRMCANPTCTNFGGACEADLHLQQCSRCRTVRYCKAACQLAHWPQHKLLCPLLMKARESNRETEGL